MRTRPRLPAGRWSTIAASLSIFLLALAVRGAFFSEIVASPVFSMLIVDSLSYDQWARRLASGKWLGDGVFYQAPLYPYLLGVFYYFLGPNALLARVAQAVLSSAACVALAAAGGRFFDRRSGIVAGVLLALHPTSLFFDSQINKSSLDLFLVCLLLVLLARAATSPAGASLATHCGIGAVLGCLTLTRENALLLVPLCVALAFFPKPSRGFRAAAARALAVILGLACTLAPVGIRNLVVGGEFHLTTSQFGLNLYGGNRQGSEGTYAPAIAGRSDVVFESRDATAIAERESGRRLSPGEVSNFWAGKALAEIRRNPRAWLALMGRKTMLFFNHVEIADTYDQYSYAAWSRLMRPLNAVLHFGLLLPLAAAGVTLTRSRWRQLWILYAFVAIYSASVIVFFVYSRLRFPVVPVLLLFAGAGIVRMIRVLSVRDLREAAAATGCMVIAGVLAFWPLIDDRVANYQAVMHSNIGLFLQNQGKLDGARSSFERALSLDPWSATANQGMGDLLRKTGRYWEALPLLERAVEREPARPESHLSLGRCYSALGRSADALSAYRAALGLDPENAWTHFWMSQELEKVGRREEAERSLAEARRIDPGFR